MSPRYGSPEGYDKEIEDNRVGLRSPKDGAVFYSNGGKDVALTYVAKERKENRAATTLEQTEYGDKLDKDELWRNTPENREFNKRERDRQKSAGQQNVDPRLAGTKRVWGRASQTYAEEARGKVTVVTNDSAIDEKSFFAKYERGALIRNEKVTHVNGVEREQLEIKLNALEKAKAQRSVGQTAAERTKSEMAYNEALADLNTAIEKGDPTRKKSMSEIRKDPAATKPQSVWDRHHKSSHKPGVQKSIGKSK